MVGAPEGGLSRAMQWINVSYSVVQPVGDRMSHCKTVSPVPTPRRPVFRCRRTVCVVRWRDDTAFLTPAELCPSGARKGGGR